MVRAIAAVLDLSWVYGEYRTLFGREVLVPIALAVLMSFVIAPPVRRLQAWYVPRILAVILVVLLAFAAIFSLGGLMVSQVNQLATDLPQYQSTLREKIKSLRGAAAVTGTLERLLLHDHGGTDPDAIVEVDDIVVG
jgi:predicted PurR-regulated permease PerM